MGSPGVKVVFPGSDLIRIGKLNRRDDPLWEGPERKRSRGISVWGPHLFGPISICRGVT